MSLFSLYRQPFLRYRPIFKIAIFVYETWPLTKDPEVAHMLSIYPSGSKLSLFLPYGKWFRDTGQISNCHIWAGNLAIGQSSRSRTYTLFLLHGVEIELISLFETYACTYTSQLPPESRISLRFTLSFTRLVFSKIMAIFFPLATMLIFFKVNLKFQNSYILSNFYYDCHKEHSEKNCRRSSLLKFLLP